MKLMIIAIILLLFSLSCAKELMIQYSEENQVLHHYFNGLTDQLFVDIGTTGSLFELASTAFSNWNGLIVQANRTRLVLHHSQTANSHKLGFAVGNQPQEKTTLAKYLSSDEPSSSSQQAQVVSLQRLCEAYFVKAPKLLTITVQSQIFSVLQSNDWNNPLCVPEVIVVPSVDPSSMGSQREKMQKYGYQLAKFSGNKQVYLLKSKAAKYQQTYQKNYQNRYDWRWVTWQSLSHQLHSTINPQFRHIFQLIFARPGILSIKKIAEQQSKRGTDLKPIIILQYNPRLSKLYFGTTSFTTKTIAARREELIQFTAKYSFGEQKVYVLNHFFRRLKPVEVVDKEAFELSKEQLNECANINNKKVQVFKYLKS